MPYPFLSTHGLLLTLGTLPVLIQAETKTALFLQTGT